jgi:hypothetical protein
MSEETAPFALGDTSINDFTALEVGDSSLIMFSISSSIAILI